MMKYTTLGRTKLRVSKGGLGAGGFSRLGTRTRTDLTEASRRRSAAHLVRTAYESGINFFDTAEAYGTEDVVFEGLKGLPRNSYVLSTKLVLFPEEGRKSEQQMEKSLDASLESLGTDFIDVYHLHGIEPDQYTQALEHGYPFLEKMIQKGKIRFTGITEMFGGDTGHKTLTRAVNDNVWDVIMVGFNLLNQSARERVLKKCRENNIGVLDMFAVRRTLQSPENLHPALTSLAVNGKITWMPPEVPRLLPALDPGEESKSLPDLAYRFVKSEPGIHTVLFGTGNPVHLHDNIRSLERPDLTAGTVDHLRRLFEGLDFLSGQENYS